MNKLSGRLLTYVTILVVSFMFIAPNTAVAITAEQRRILESGAGYFDIDETDLLCSADVGNTGESASGRQKLFFIGDSLTRGMTVAGGLLEKAAAAGFDVSPTYNSTTETINGYEASRVQGPSVEATGGISISGTMPRISDTANQSAIATSNIIIIGLGTNREPDRVPKINTLIAAIKAVPNYNPATQIYWVNTYYNGGTTTYDMVNADINSASGGGSNYRVIDFATAAIGDPVAFALTSDGAHHDATGYGNKADFILRQIRGTGGTTPIQSGTTGIFDPLSLTFPTFPNEAEVAQAMQRELESYPRRSPWLDIPNVGEWIMRETKSRNINPMFIMTIGRQENGYGTVGEAPRQNNFFGMTARGGGYLSFPSVEAGMTAFMDAVQNNLQGDGAGGRYRQAKNIYEYISIHQTGRIVYPGEPFDPNDVTGPQIVGGALVTGRSARPVPDGNTADGYDPNMGVYISWNEQRNSRVSWPLVPERYEDGVYNPLVYYRNAISVVNSLLGLNLSPDNPRNSTATSTASCVSGDGGNSTTTSDGAAAPGVNGWDLPSEGPNPLKYFYSQICSGCTPFPAAYTDFYGFLPAGQVPPNTRYGTGTLQAGGCGPTSVAMVVSNLTGRKVEATEMAEFFAANGAVFGSGSNSGAFGSQAFSDALERTYGVRSRRISSGGHNFNAADAAAVTAEIRAGNFVVGSFDNSSPVSTRSGSAHIITIRAFTDDGRFLFADTGDSNTKNRQNTEIIPAGVSRTPLTPEQIGLINTGLYAFERVID